MVVVRVATLAAIQVQAATTDVTHLVPPEIHAVAVIRLAPVAVRQTDVVVHHQDAEALSVD